MANNRRNRGSICFDRRKPWTVLHWRSARAAAGAARRREFCGCLHVWINEIFGLRRFRQKNRVIGFLRMAVREKDVAFAFVQTWSPIRRRRGVGQIIQTSRICKPARGRNKVSAFDVRPFMICFAELLFQSVPETNSNWTRANSKER